MSVRCELLDNVNRAIEYLRDRIDTLVLDRDRDVSDRNEDDVAQEMILPSTQLTSNAALPSIVDQWIEDLRKVLSILTGEE